MKLRVETTFCFGHRLHNHDGVCSRLHGHNARVVLEIDGKLNPKTGMIMDFVSIKGLLRAVVLELDHKMLLHTEDWLCGKLLSEEMGAAKDGEPEDLGIYPVPWIPTAENIALHIYHRLVEEESTFTGVLMWVTVYETCTSSVTVNQHDAMLGRL